MPSRKYIYSSLTAAIDDKQSPLRRYLDSEYPNRRPLQAAYRAAAPPILVQGGDAHPGTLGAAFDFAVRFVLDPEYVPAVAIHAFRPSRRRVKAITHVIAVARSAANCRTSLAPELLLRASWALALTTEVFRAGTWQHSPLRQLGWFHFTAERLLRLAQPDALVQLQQLHSVATTSLFPKLPLEPRRQTLGPSFAASRLCSADADIIIDGQLIELKTRLGSLSQRTGNRSDSIPGTDINQLLAYTLFDQGNKYKIDRVSLYSARYGNFTTWPLNDYLTLLSGRRVDIKAERAIVWRLLGGS